MPAPALGEGDFRSGYVAIKSRSGAVLESTVSTAFWPTRRQNGEIRALEPSGLRGLRIPLVGAHAGQKAQCDEHEPDSPADDFGNFDVDGSQKHDECQRADGPKRTVLEIAEHAQSLVVDEFDGHRADEERANTQTQRQDGEVLGDGEGANDAVETETGVLDFKKE